jgi:hypothetical protein
MINAFLFLAVLSVTALLVLSVVQDKKHLEHSYEDLTLELYELYTGYFEFSHKDTMKEISKLDHKQTYEYIKKIRLLQKKERTSSKAST